MTDPAKKLLDLPAAVRWREKLRAAGRRLVVTNGCFDLLHRGHAEYLYMARRRGDALLVLINSDESVRRLKGPSRPVVGEVDRAYLLGALAAVDRVVIFAGMRCARELAALAPDLYIKAGDYTLATLDPEERTALTAAGSEVEFAPFVGGFSTTSLIQRILGR